MKGSWHVLTSLFQKQVFLFLGNAASSNIGRDLYQPPVTSIYFFSFYLALCCSHNFLPLFLQLKEILDLLKRSIKEIGSAVKEHLSPRSETCTCTFFCSSTGKQFHFLAHANLSLFAEFFCKNIARNVTKAFKQMMLFFCLWLAFFLDYANSTPLLSHNSIFLLYLILTSE